MVDNIRVQAVSKLCQAWMEGGGFTQLGDIWVVDSNAEAFDIAVGKDVEVHVIVLTGQVFKPEYQSLSEPVFEAGLDYAGLFSFY